MSTLKKKLMASFATIALSTTGVMAATASSPAYAAGGTASCAMNEIVGIWIEVDGGRSGWADRKLTNNPRINQWSYDTQGKCECGMWRHSAELEVDNRVQLDFYPRSRHYQLRRLWVLQDL